MQSNCQHQPEEIAYICCNENCLKFLCNKCHDTHKTNHSDPFDILQIKPINEIKEIYKNKVDDTINSLKNQLDKLNYYKQDITDNSQLEEGLKMIQVSEEELIRNIKRYFQKYKNDFKTEVEFLKEERIKEFNNVKKRVDSVIDNLKNIKKNLNDNTNEGETHKELKKLISIDLSYEVKRYDTLIVDLNANLYDFKLNREKINEIIKLTKEYLALQTKSKKADLSASDIYSSNSSKPELKTLPPTNMSKSSPNSAIDSPAKDKKEPYSHKDFEVNLEDYFDAMTELKLLHYFESSSKNVYLLHIEEAFKNPNPVFQKVPLIINFDIPLRHRSIITPYGEIFLYGGIEGTHVLNNTYFLNIEKRTLEPRAMMNVNRKSHGVAYCNGFIYAIGGVNNTDVFLTKCERYDVSKDKWQIIADLCVPVSSPCVCSFRNKYLYKFGGLIKLGHLNKQIEKLDIEKNIWIRYEIEVSEHSSKAGLRLLWLSACVQINPNQIYIFGGCEYDDKPSKSSFLFEIQEKSILSGNEFRIKKINTIQLPVEGGFWNHQVILHNNQVVCLQNILKGTTEAYEDKRNTLVFRNYAWGL